MTLLGATFHLLFGMATNNNKINQCSLHAANCLGGGGGGYTQICIILYFFKNRWDCAVFFFTSPNYCCLINPSHVEN